MIHLLSLPHVELHCLTIKKVTQSQIYIGKYEHLHNGYWIGISKSLGCKLPVVACRTVARQRNIKYSTIFAD